MEVFRPKCNRLIIPPRDFSTDRQWLSVAGGKGTKVPQVEQRAEIKTHAENI
jgi:hypothetical protein